MTQVVGSPAYPRRPSEVVDALLRAKIHIADMLEAGVTIKWIQTAAGISERRLRNFTSGSSIHRYDAAFAEAVLALSPLDGVAACSGMAINHIARHGPDRMTRASAMRDEVARDLEQERERRRGIAMRAMLPLPSVANLSPRRSLVVGVDERRAPGEIRPASQTLDAMRAAARLPMRRVLRPVADVAKARGQASIWLPLAEDGEVAVEAQAVRVRQPPDAGPPVPPVLLVRSVPGSPRSSVRSADRIATILAEALCGGDVDGLWDVCLRTSDLALADLADLACPDVAQWRIGALMPAARCRTCRDRLVAPGRRSMCDLCAFEVHDRMARRVRHGVPDPPQRIPEAPWPDASMPRAVPVRAHIPAPRPSAERCGRCGGALGVRREVCGACAFDLFMEAAERARADGVPVE